jgi:hypothetical protein
MGDCSRSAAGVAVPAFSDRSDGGVERNRATYTGSVSGKSMSGNWSSPPGGGTWSAHKMSARKHKSS